MILRNMMIEIDMWKKALCICEDQVHVHAEDVWMLGRMFLKHYRWS